MAVQKSFINLAKEYVNACRENGLTFQKVYLFGSVAENKNTGDSDVDIALISDQFTDNILQNWQLLAPIDFKFPQIDSHPYSISYFRKKTPMIEEILKRGVLID